MEAHIPPVQKPGWFLWLGWIVAVAVVLIVSVGFVFARQRLIARQTSELTTARAQGPRVVVVPVTPGAGTSLLELPATIHGYIETPVYAKVAGYLKTIRVDKGDRVHQGDLIARIESPETDKAVADALANYKLQLITDRRYQYLLAHEVIARQEADMQHAAMLQAKATYEQQVAMQQYETVRAPFDGIVTARYVDQGTLIPQSTSPSTGNPIIAMATQAPVRIYADVPQTLSPFVRDGDTATITASEFPGRKFIGTITRHPDALDPNTRTMLVEVDLPNTDHALLPGMYVKLKIATRGATGAMFVPDDAIIFRNDQTYLPLVRDGHVHLVAVALSRDDGYRVQVTGDLQIGDLVAMNLGQAVRDGAIVQPIRPTT